MMKCAPWPVLLKMEMGAVNLWEEVNNLLYYTWFCFLRASGLRHLMVKDKFTGSRFLTLSRGNMNGAAVKLHLMQPRRFLHTSWDSLICIKICYKLTSMFPCFKTGTVELGLSWSSESFLFDVLFGIQAVAPPPHPLSTFSYHSCCSPSSCSSLKHAELINRPATGSLSPVSSHCDTWLETEVISRHPSIFPWCSSRCSFYFFDAVFLFFQFPASVSFLSFSHLYQPNIFITPSPAQGTYFEPSIICIFLYSPSLSVI